MWAGAVVGASCPGSAESERAERTTWNRAGKREQPWVSGRGHACPSGRTDASTTVLRIQWNEFICDISTNYKPRMRW